MYVWALLQELEMHLFAKGYQQYPLPQLWRLQTDPQEFEMVEAAVERIFADRYDYLPWFELKYVAFDLFWSWKIPT